MKKVGFVSLGCPKNLVDSEVMMGTLAEAGYEITNNADEADTVVVNTCGFIESAKQESIDAILEATRLKDEGKAKRVIVAGCLVERYRDDLMKELPEVDAFIGTSQVDEILKAADEQFDAHELTHHADRQQDRDISLRRIHAADACDRIAHGVYQDRRGLRPAVCVLFDPVDAGFFRSRRFGSIIEEARMLAKQGVKEVVLIAQDSSRYGEDLGEVDALAALIRALGEIEELEWVRVMYAYPTHISDAFLAAIAETPKAVKYLDMPLQHASRNVLKLMKRGGTRESLEKLDRARARKSSRHRDPHDIYHRLSGRDRRGFRRADDIRPKLPVRQSRRLYLFGRRGNSGVRSAEQGRPEDRQAAPQPSDEGAGEDQQAAEPGKDRTIRTRLCSKAFRRNPTCLFQGRFEGQAQEIDGYILINDMPEELRAADRSGLRRADHRGPRIRSRRGDRLKASYTRPVSFFARSVNKSARRAGAA